MLPAAARGIAGFTVRADDSALLDLLTTIEDPECRAAATAERAMLGILDGSCRTPIGAYARLQPDGSLILNGMVARADGRCCSNARWPACRSIPSVSGANLVPVFAPICLRADSSSRRFASPSVRLAATAMVTRRYR
jgi:hypothetical protein